MKKFDFTIKRSGLVFIKVDNRVNEFLQQAKENGYRFYDIRHLEQLGLILGIVDCVKKSKANASGKGMGIAGLILSAIAIPIIINFLFFFIDSFIP